LTEELKELKQRALRELDHFFSALIDSREVLHIIPEASTSTIDFLMNLMVEFFNSDCRLGMPPEGAGWGTINRFYRHCEDEHPHWASRQTFYNKMHRCLDYLLAQDMVFRRAPKKRRGISKADFEYRINPANPYVQRLIASLDSSPPSFV
jgi:hypothetical protein